MRTAVAALGAALLASSGALPAVSAVQAAVPPSDAAPQQVRIHLVLSRRPIGTLEERNRIRELQEELLALLDARGAGRLARDAWPEGACILTLEGPDAREVWAVVEAPVRAFRPLPGSYALVATGTGMERIPLDPADAPAVTPPP